MSQITKFFNLEEFQCKCGCEMPDAVEDNIVNLLVPFMHPPRLWLGLVWIVTSGYRCVPYNRSKGGVPNSQHILGTAADIVVKGVPIYSLRDMLNLGLKAHKHGPGGLGYYPKYGGSVNRTRDRWGFLHIDLRETSRAVRWSG